MNDRQEEINLAINMIYNICTETNICLIPKEKNGVNFVAIHDNINNKDYAIIKDK
jgi:hypothetical protein